ncbi:uncharacterized protein [Amphiura filiformis]|uniref:uncharacterized protein n=1 Tax=Amphiura filiformis TaxID=82378 RepID=UPI003B2202DA
MQSHSLSSALMMNNFTGDGPFCGKRRQPFDDGDSEMISSSAVDQFGQTTSVFSGSNGRNLDPNANQGTFPAPKRVCSGVSSFHSGQMTSSSSSQNLPNQTMQPYQDDLHVYPPMGGDSKLFLDSPPHSDHDTMETDTMETEENGAVHPVEPLGGGRGRFYNGALYNMGDIGQQLQGVDDMQRQQNCKGSQRRVCIRCLAGEPGHITHILECIS